MATLYSSRREIPSLSSTATQNTAPVHEYRCLYTRDLHKKAKKWHDGSLRFHTFNRRVMVYDDSKNYIGDLHYRQEDAFGEGVEIELDRGIKVEVGEPSGQTETDIAPILARQRPEKPAAQSKQSSPIHSRTNPNQHSQRPKSLLEVLGPSQRRHARSGLQLLSPYEQRQAGTDSAPRNVLHKRRKLSSEKENQPESSETLGLDVPIQIGKPTRPTLPARVQRTPSRGPVKQFPQSTITFEEVLDISSDDGEGLQAHTNGNEAARRGCRTAVQRPAQGSREVRSTKVNISTSEHRLLESTSKRKRVGTLPSRDRAVEENTLIVKPQEPSAIGSIPRPRPSKLPTARLLLSLPQPRRKLLHLVPLPPGLLETRRKPRVWKADLHSPNSTSHSPSSVDLDSPAANSLYSSLHGSPPATPANEDDEIQSAVAPEQAEPWSPLFVPTGRSQRRSPSPSILPVPEDISSPSLEETQCPSNGDGPAIDRFAEQNSIVEDSRPDCHTIAGFDLSQCSSNSGPEQDPREMSPLDVAELVETSDLNTTQRAFRRVVSETDAAYAESSNHRGDPRLGSIRNMELPDTLGSRRSPSKASPSKVKPPPKLHRCASDTAAIHARVDAAPESHSESRETGPWTSEESFLLFDWWPAQLEKPDFWKAAEEMSQSIRAPPTVHGFSTRITTARQFLHNDVL